MRTLQPTSGKSYTERTESNSSPNDVEEAVGAAVPTGCKTASAELVDAAEPSVPVALLTATIQIDNNITE